MWGRRSEVRWMLVRKERTEMRVEKGRRREERKGRVWPERMTEGGKNE